MKPVRVRFAPSPTGVPHIGNTRTALFDWLLARQTGGQFIVRVEDTDRKRYQPESLEKILAILEFLGLSWDEGPKVGGPHQPYFQSQRLGRYQEVAQKLVDNAIVALYAVDHKMKKLVEVSNNLFRFMNFDKGSKVSDVEKHDAHIFAGSGKFIFLFNISAAPPVSSPACALSPWLTWQCLKSTKLFPVPGIAFRLNRDENDPRAHC